jgi:hypothetical protein
MNRNVLESHLALLSYGCRLEVTEDFRIVVAKEVLLPPGWSRPYTDVLIEIPDDYPFAVPGRDSRIYLQMGLKFHGQTPSDYHEEGYDRPGWAWWCYEDISWDPNEDNLIRLLEMLRTDLGHPL